MLRYLPLQMSRSFAPYFSSIHNINFPLCSSFHPKEFCCAFLITEDLEAPNWCNHIWGGMWELFILKRNKLPGSLQGEVRGRDPISPVWWPIANLWFLQDSCWSTSRTSHLMANLETLLWEQPLPGLWEWMKSQLQVTKQSVYYGVCMLNLFSHISCMSLLL